MITIDRDVAIIVLGHSHVGVLHEALEDLPKVDTTNGAHFYVHDVWKNRTDYARSSDNGGVEFNQDVLDEINAIVPLGMKRLYVSMMGGNGHILLALEKHPRPFDFISSELPDLEIDHNAEILPEDFLKAILKPLMMSYIWHMVSFRSAVNERTFVIETPPPYQDDEYVKLNLGQYIKKPENIVQSSHRLKMWRLHSSIIAEICAASDIQFVHAPPESLEGGGFMRREGYGPDATHANKWYGQLLVQQILQLAGVENIVSYTRFAESNRRPS